MYNKITLIGTITEQPHEMYAPNGDRSVFFSLNVPLPSDAPQTHWGLVFDLRPSGSGSGWTVGDDTFLIACRARLLVEKCLHSLHKGDLVCVEGRLVLTLLHSHGDLVPLAEVLANEVILLKEV